MLSITRKPLRTRGRKDLSQVTIICNGKSLVLTVVGINHRNNGQSVLLSFDGKKEDFTIVRNEILKGVPPCEPSPPSVSSVAAPP